MSDWLIGLISFGTLGIAIVASEWLRKRLDWPGESTRKFTHISAGILVFVVGGLMSSKQPALFLGVFFTLFDFVAIRFRWLKGIHNTQRTTYGTAFYPLAFSILVFVYWEHHRPVILLAMLILALGDAAAALVGRGVKRPRVFQLTDEPKSMQGSLTMALVTCLVVSIGFYYLQNRYSLPSVTVGVWVMAAVVGMVATAAEALSWRGSDNLSTPLISAVAIHVFLYGSEATQWQFITGVVLASLVAVISFKVQFLNAGGAVAAFLIGAIIFGLGGWSYSLPLLLFFVTSSLLSRIGSRAKLKFEEIFEKGHVRDAGQVLANGGVPALLATIAYLMPEVEWYPVFLGAVAAVTADTWATEIGVLSGARPRNVLSFRQVDSGTSGAVSVKGTVAAMVGALFIACVGVAFMVHATSDMIVLAAAITGAGIVGSMTDSYLGASLQIQYRCSSCGKSTEKDRHCSSPAVRLRGLQLFNNNFVNAVCAGSGALAAWAFIRATEY